MIAFEARQDPIEDVTRAYLMQNIPDEEDDSSWPTCCQCGCRIDPADGMYTAPVWLSERKYIELPLHRSCYETGFDGGTEWNEQDIRTMWRNK